MALTVIPIKEYELLTKNANEASKNKIRFSWDIVEKDYSKSYRDILSYMSMTDVKKIGSGSGRTAFFLPPGDWKKDRSTPICFKVAKNKKGVAQNKVEIDLFSEYGKQYSCFPEMFEYDKNNQYYLLTEVGRPLKDGELANYFMSWNSYIEDMLFDSYGRAPFYYFDCINSTAGQFNESFTEHVYEICKALNVSGIQRGWTEDPQSVLDDMDRISKEFPKYSGLTSLFRFSVDGGWKKIRFDDFSANVQNWAIVTRNAEELLIPIDYGFSDEVVKQFYTD